MRPLLRWVIGVSGLLAGLGAQAACNVSSPTLAFGSYQPLSFGTKLSSANVDSTTNINLTCTSGLLSCLLAPVTYSIAISAGQSGSVIGRQMSGSGTSAGSTMNYNLYTNGARTIVWGDGTTGAIVGGTVASCGSASHVVYGRIGAGQNLLKAGPYGEPLTVTVTYSP